MESSSLPPSQSKRLSIAVSTIGSAGIEAAPGSDPDSAPAEESEGQIRHITLRTLPSATGASPSIPIPKVVSQAQMPGGIIFEDPSSDAQSSSEAMTGKSKHAGYQPPPGEADVPSAEPMPLHPVSLRLADASATVEEEAAVAEADIDWPLHLAPGVCAMTTGLSLLPNEVLLQVLSYLDVCDLLCTSHVS